MIECFGELLVDPWVLGGMQPVIVVNNGYSSSLNDIAHPSSAGVIAYTS